jgi:hypothetical protein
LEKRAEQVLPGSEGVRGERRSGGRGREMTQTVYAHMNKRIKKKIKQNPELKRKKERRINVNLSEFLPKYRR